MTLLWSQWQIDGLAGQPNNGFERIARPPPNGVCSFQTEYGCRGARPKKGITNSNKGEYQEGKCVSGKIQPLLSTEAIKEVTICTTVESNLFNVADYRASKGQEKGRLRL